MSKIAQKGDWQTEPMPAQSAKFQLKRHFTKEQMAAWEAEATAAGGKLYVRFLTEHEGELTTVPVK